MRLTAKQVMTGMGAYFVAAVGGYLYLRSAKAPAPTPGCGCGGRHPREQGEGGSEAGEQDGQATFDRLADEYDSLIGVDETVMGLKLMRRWLMRHAEGDVLEVSAGTGRNLQYYPLSRLRSLTVTDTSRGMLVNAADKWAALAAKQGDHAPPVRFELADAQHLTAQHARHDSGDNGSAAEPSSGSSSGSSSSRAAEASRSGSSSGRVAEASSSGSGEAAEAPGTPRQDAEAAPASAPLRPQLREQRSFAPASFDVVVDTFGLCSQEDPVTALKEMARVCKPGGRILLLQHGKGTWDFVNGILDSGAAQHFAKWGCWWNRDIGTIVRQAGLRVESESRWHFGTTYMIVARPPASCA